MSSQIPQDVRLQYKSDDLGNPVYARVCWEGDSSQTQAKAIVIITHAGGLVVGSSAMVPAPQINYLTSRNIIVVIPNYRLAPQVTATKSFADVVDAYTWSQSKLQSLLPSHVKLDASRTATYGHSIGGTMALHLAASFPEHINATTALYPSLFISDKSTTSYAPYTKPPFGTAPDFTPSEEQWAEIAPKTEQISETPLMIPGTVPKPRTLWQFTLLKHGKLMSTIQPDGNLESVDPILRAEEVNDHWPPTMFVSPMADDVPGSGHEYIRRAMIELQHWGARTVRLVEVPDQVHMFDMPPMIGTSDLGEKWQAVKKGLDFVVEKLQ